MLIHDFDQAPDHTMRKAQCLLWHAGGFKHESDLVRLARMIDAALVMAGISERPVILNEHKGALDAVWPAMPSKAAEKAVVDAWVATFPYECRGSVSNSVVDEIAAFEAVFSLKATGDDALARMTEWHAAPVTNDDAVLDW
jgi:hypothetical protein